MSTRLFDTGDSLDYVIKPNAPISFSAASANAGSVVMHGGTEDFEVTFSIDSSTGQILVSGKTSEKFSITLLHGWILWVAWGVLGVI